MSDGVAPSKGAWTPGPWSYDGDEDGDFVIWGPGRDEFLANVDQESFGPVPPMKIAFDINQANALLISKSPQMAELLRELTEYFKASLRRPEFAHQLSDDHPLVRAERLLSELEVKPSGA